MSLKLQALGFLKEKKIRYYIVDDLIYFSCVNCSEKAEMDAHTTTWHCECGNKGNLGNLILINREEVSLPPTKDFINPKQEKYEINHLLNKLSKQLGDEGKSIIVIQAKFNKLCKEFGI